MALDIFKKISQIFGYLIISITCFSVLIRTIFFVRTKLDSIFWLITLVIIGLFLIFGLFQHAKELINPVRNNSALSAKERDAKSSTCISNGVKDKEQKSYGSKGLNNVKIILACFLGSLATYYLSVSCGLGPFVSSGLVGIIVAKFCPKFAPCVYTASFAGMSSQNVLPTIFHSMLVGIIVGIVFIICQTVFEGFGGKLGVMAFFSGLFISLVSKPQTELIRLPDLIQGLVIVLSCVFGSIVTCLLSMRMKAGPVMASGIITLIGGIFLPCISPLIGQNLASSLTAGTYAGMSSKEVIGSKLYMGLAGMVAGIILVLGVPVFYGLGGKLGAVAFLGVTTIWRLNRMNRKKN